MIELPLATLLVTVLKEIRVAWREKKSDRPPRLAPEALLALHESSRRLIILSTQCENVINATGKITETDAAIVKDFISEVEQFGRCLFEINITLIDIYYPGLKDDFFEIINSDINILGYFNMNLAPKYNISKKTCPRALDVFVRNITESGTWSHQYRFFSLGTPSSSETIERLLNQKEARRRLLDLIKCLDECRVVLGDIIKSNWSLKELAQGKDQ